MALSRVEGILESKINQTTYDKEPLSRIEELLLNLPAGGGSSGDYSPVYDFDDIDIEDVFGDLGKDNHPDTGIPEDQDLDDSEIDDIFSGIGTDKG